MTTQLAYQIPDGGRRKTILRVPESHSLYLCPDGCARRQGIRSLRNGEAGHASFLRLSQSDVALGDYVGQAAAAVGEVLARVRPRPRVLTLHVNCVDDFLGTDGDALLAELASRHPDVRFLLSHVSPIAADVREAGGSPAFALHANLYAPLEPVGPQGRDAGVNLVGCYVAPPRTGELHELLAALGTPAGLVRCLPECASYDEYRAMAASRLALSLGRMGDGAAEDMRVRLGIPWMAWPACYDLDEIARRYEGLAMALGAAAKARPGAPAVAPEAAGPDASGASGADASPPMRGDMSGRRASSRATLPSLLAPHRARALAAVEAAREALGGLPVYVDTSASLAPFSLAETLLAWGLNVRAVFALHSKGWDDAARARLVAAHPELVVVERQGLEAIQGMGLPREAVALSRDAGFLVRTRHVAELYHDEGCFGYDGVARLADALVEALATEREWA